MYKRFLVLTLSTLFIAVSFIGCATNKSSGKSPDFDKKPISLAGGREYDILGTVTLERSWFGILGLSVATVDAYVYQQGGATYVNLLEAARREYPTTDAVVDIKVDYEGSFYAIFYAKRNYILHGLAIKYKDSSEK